MSFEAGPAPSWQEAAVALARGSSLKTTRSLARLAGTRTSPRVFLRPILYEHTIFIDQRTVESPGDYEQRMYDDVAPYLVDPRIVMVCMEITGHPDRNAAAVYARLAAMRQFLTGQTNVAPQPTAATLMMSAVAKRRQREHVYILPEFRPANSYMVTGDDARAISLVRPAAPELPRAAAAARVADILDFREGLSAEQLIMQYMPEAAMAVPEGLIPDEPVIVAMLYGRRHELFVRLMQELDVPIERVVRLGQLALTPQGWLEDQFRLSNVDYDRCVQIAAEADVFADTMHLVIAIDHYVEHGGEQFDVHEQQQLRAALGWLSIRATHAGGLTEPQQTSFNELRVALNTTPLPANDGEFIGRFALSTYELANTVYATLPPEYYEPFAP